MIRRHPQIDGQGRLRHLLSIDGLPKAMIERVLDTASAFLDVSDRTVKKLPLLRGRSVFNLFFENSTRTRTTFEIAAQRLSADVFNLNISASSASTTVEPGAISSLEIMASMRSYAMSAARRLGSGGFLAWGGVRVLMGVAGQWLRE